MAKTIKFRQALIGWRQDRNRAKTFAARIAALQRWAAVVVKSDGRTTQERREAFRRGWTKPLERVEGTCWACRQKAFLVRHHVIQLQHGGNSNHLNVERICDICHALVHPWLASRV